MSYANYMADHQKDFEVTVTRSPHVDLNGRNQFERAQSAAISNFLAENIGRASRGLKSDASTIATLHNQMMTENGGHRENILESEARIVGMGIVRTRNRFYMTEEFSK